MLLTSRAARPRGLPGRYLLPPVREGVQGNMPCLLSALDTATNIRRRASGDYRIDALTMRTLLPLTVHRSRRAWRAGGLWYQQITDDLV